MVNKVIRPLDGYEIGLYYFWISIADIFEIDSFDHFKQNIEIIFKQLPVFNLAVQKIDGNLFWVNEPFILDIEEFEWDDNYEKNMKSSISAKIPMPPLDNRETNDNITKLCRFRYALKNNKCMVYLYLNHVITDGRSIFDAHSLVKQIIEAIKSGKSFDEITHKYTPIEGVPNTTTMKFVIASNLGRTNATSPKLNLYGPCTEQFSIILYSYYNDRKFYMMLYYPNTLDDRYIQTVRYCVEEVFKNEIGSNCLNN